MTKLGDLFECLEAENSARVRDEMAAEKAAFDALPQAEKDRLIAEQDARWEALIGPEDADTDDDTDDEDDDTEEAA